MIRLAEMEHTTSTGNNGDSPMPDHLHDPLFVTGATRQRPVENLIQHPSTSLEGPMSDEAVDLEKHTEDTLESHVNGPESDPDDRRFRRIIRNFTPSYVHLCSLSNL